MRRRLGGVVVWSVLVFSTAVVSAGQTGPVVDEDYRVPRTPDGQPDISGIWRNDTLTPLERPTRLGDQVFFT